MVVTVFVSTHSSRSICILEVRDSGRSCQSTDTYCRLETGRGLSKSSVARDSFEVIGLGDASDGKMCCFDAMPCKETALRFAGCSVEWSSMLCGN